MPWLNRVNTQWLQEAISFSSAIYVLEDHAPVGGLGDCILNALVSTELLDGRRFQKFAIEGYPAWGTPPEVLQHHGLDGAALSKRITHDLGIELR